MKAKDGGAVTDCKFLKLNGNKKSAFLSFIKSLQKTPTEYEEVIYCNLIVARMMSLTYKYQVVIKVVSSQTNYILI